MQQSIDEQFVNRQVPIRTRTRLVGCHQMHVQSIEQQGYLIPLRLFGILVQVLQV